MVIPHQYLLTLLILANYQAVYVASWDLVGGYTRQINGGQAFFFGGGAYVLALAGLYGLPPWFGYLAILLAALAMGSLFGFLGVRLTGPFLIIATLAVAEIVHELALSRGFMTAKGYAVGGESGFPVSPLFPAGTPAYGLNNFYLSTVFLVVSLAVLLLVVRSRHGLILRAVASDETAAEAVGLDTARIKQAAFVASSVVSALAGAGYAQFLNLATPSALSLEQSFSAIVLATAGGRGTIIGPALAAYVMTAVFGWLTLNPAVRLLTYCVLLLLTTRFYPQGLLGRRRR